ncbi:MAG: hypothetical protein LUD16_05515 [Lachnospiraceae bacterium]|nr:hypothetical protein [Lachnospiraceae bacterium]
MQYFHVAVAGTTEGKDENKTLLRKISNLLVEAQMRMEDVLPEEDSCQIRLFVQDRFTNEFWTQIAAENQMELRKIDEISTKKTDAPMVRVASNQELLVQADLFIALWDESFEGQEGAIWDLIQRSKEENIPCIWVSKKEPYRTYWAVVSYFEEYDKDDLRKYCTSIFCRESKPQQEKKVPLISLGEKLYTRFLRKYKATDIPDTYEKDVLLDRDGSLSDAAEEAVRTGLLDQFLKYDERALVYSSRYRASIYWRSILPFLATVFIAIGFYAETLFGFTILSTQCWEILAGIGFLLHAGVNLYAFYLSKNPQVQSWHADFLKNRVLAEVLRVYIHICPFGYSLNLRTLMDKCGIDMTQKSGIYGTLREILRKTENPEIKREKGARDDCLANLRLLVEDQLAYHQKSRKRYEKIADTLSRYGKAMFFAGFLIVVFRGILQFFMPAASWTFTRNGIALKSFVKSFANFLALFIPAWASYFTSKLSLGEFDFMKKNDEEMILCLEQCREILDAAQQHEVSDDMFQVIVEQVAVLQLSEVSGWRNETAKKIVSNI